MGGRKVAAVAPNNRAFLCDTALRHGCAVAQVLTPMAILTTLQRSSTLTLDVAKGFLQQYVRRQQSKAEHHGSKIAQLQTETAQLAASVHSKRTEPFVRPPHMHCCHAHALWSRLACAPSRPLAAPQLSFPLPMP